MKKATMLCLAVLLIGMVLMPRSATAQIYIGRVIYVGPTSVDILTGRLTDATYNKVDFLLRGKVIGTITLGGKESGLLTVKGLDPKKNYIFEYKAYLANGTTMSGQVFRGNVRTGDIAGILLRPDTVLVAATCTDSVFVYPSMKLYSDGEVLPGGRLVLGPGANLADTLGFSGAIPGIKVYGTSDPANYAHGIVESYGGILRNINVTSTGQLGPFNNLKILGSDFIQEADVPMIFNNCIFDKWVFDDFSFVNSVPKKMEVYNTKILNEAQLTGVLKMVKCTVQASANVYCRQVDSCTFIDGQLVLKPEGEPTTLRNSVFKTSSIVRFTNKSVANYNIFDPTSGASVSPSSDGYDPSDIKDFHFNFNEMQYDTQSGAAANFLNTGADSLDCTKNYWGRCTGPAPGDFLGQIIYQPFLRDAYPKTSYWMNVWPNKEVIIANDDDEITFSGHLYNVITNADSAGAQITCMVTVSGDTLYNVKATTDANGRFTFTMKMPPKYLFASTCEVFFKAVQCIEIPFLISVSEQVGPDLEVSDARIIQVHGITTDIMASKPFAVKANILTSELVTNPFKVTCTVNNVVYDTFYVESKPNIGLRFNYQNPRTTLTFPKLENVTVVFFIDEKNLVPGETTALVVADPPSEGKPKGELLEMNENNNRDTARSIVRASHFGPGATADVKVLVQPFDFNFPVNGMVALQRFVDSTKSFIEKAWPIQPNQMAFTTSPTVLNPYAIHPDSLQKETWQRYLQIAYKMMRIENPAFDRYVLATDKYWFRGRFSPSKFEHKTSVNLSWAGIYDLMLTTNDNHLNLVHSLGHSYGLRRGDLDTLQDEEYFSYYIYGKEVMDGIDVDARRLISHNTTNQNGSPMKAHCFMGGGRTSNQIYKWVCDEDYTALMGSFASLRSNPGGLKKAPVAKAMLVEGTVSRATGDLHFGSWERLSNATPSAMVDQRYATHVFKVQDQNGTELARYLYKPTFVCLGLDEDGLDSDPVMDTEYFSFVVPYSDDARKIVVEKNGVPVAERIVSANAPTFSFITPTNNGTVMLDASHQVTAKWNATDPDGETTFWYTVSISEDRGVTWMPLTYEETITEKTFEITPNKEYRLKAIASDGVNKSSEVIITFNGQLLAAEGPAAATDFGLQQNYPNPFNPSTQVSFTIPASGLVTLDIHDALGRKVRTLVDSRLEAGVHSVTFDGQGLPSGTYTAILRFGDRTSSIRMTLSK